ncbi:efflux RND transporter periplasmic adaptor subunit [Azoarcus sp. L1K30]|uniref:efflux RND transporter periplasmic adaptor subunit n=1 Tax=Azoarcus sp. L1K30 TaxID=2820277 RepID=UPI001B822F0F|nr:efflux RND transporter periplasmic adaptor subunit [Azoarcus sp. L1K30]MBR0567443.1 efflux RND transporter periplasmic adaptor subunit [Azoarcus sp. L1K30]
MKDQSDKTAAVSAPDLNSILARSGGSRSGRWRLIIAAVLVVAVAIFMIFGRRTESGLPQYRTEAARIGSLVVTVSATGNLAPTNQVNLGSELSGTIAQVLVDDDERVRKGQVLARLDLSKFEDAVAKSRGALAVAEASLKQAQATVVEARAKLDRYREVARLSGGKVPSKIEIESAQADVERADANVASARASIAEAKAALQTDLTNLSRGSIRSPIDGVVLLRAVDPGQTVAASLQAVTLFTLAEDLSKMELSVDVDEADVGSVKAGLKASFTVDAWPGRRFEAAITRVGFNATDSDGVVSYPAVLQVANDDLSLRPGMTATAEITTVSREQVLLVPNAALRYSPPAPSAQRTAGSSVLSSLMPRPPRSAPRASAPPRADDGSQRLWVLREGTVVPLQVRTGATNGRVTEIVGGDLQAGMEVITETASANP